MFISPHADALIVAWEAERCFELWRPITATRLADTDGNALTMPDPTWDSTGRYTFLAAADNSMTARIYAGIHYRFVMKPGSMPRGLPST
jgi:hypothetical protein